MKKIYLVAVAALAGAASYAQTTVYSASELTDFQTKISAVYDLDQDGKNWGAFNLTGSGLSFESQGTVLGSNSWDTVALTPDNWVLTTPIDLTGYTNVSLSWGRGAADATDFAENYAVYVVTAADQTALATALASASTGTGVYTETLASDAWVTRTVDLSAFDNTANVYIAFRHYNCTDQFILFVDDIKVEGTQTVGIETLDMSAVTASPNPAIDVLNIKGSEAIATTNVLSLDGKLISTTQGGTIDVSSLTSGVYIYEATTVSGQKAINKFVKK